LVKYHAKLLKKLKDFSFVVWIDFFDTQNGKN